MVFKTAIMFCLGFSFTALSYLHVVYIINVFVRWKHIMNITVLSRLKSFIEVTCVAFGTHLPFLVYIVSDFHAISRYIQALLLPYIGFTTSNTSWCMHIPYAKWTRNEIPDFFRAPRGVTHEKYLIPTYDFYHMTSIIWLLSYTHS